MSIENSGENIMDDITMEFPCIAVNTEHGEGIIFSWEDNGLQRYPSDRAFAVQTSKDSLPLLFQLNHKNSKSYEASQRLWNTHMFKPEVYEELIDKGIRIVNEVNNVFPTEDIPLSILSKEVVINGETYILTYMSPDIYLAGISMRDNYAKRIRERSLEKKKRFLI